MISKKEFIKTIKHIKEYEDKLTALSKISNDLTIGISSIIDWLIDDLTNTLCLACNINPFEKYDNLISWWIYDTNFGKDHAWIKSDNVKYNLSTVEKLYDYISKTYGVEGDKH